MTAGAYADMPLFLFHLLEYLDVDYELDVDEINDRWARTAGEDVWSQLIIKETDDEVELLTAAPRTGVYRLDDEGRISFARWANDWHNLIDESEAFYLQRRRARRVPLQGRGPRRAGHARAAADRRRPARPTRCRQLDRRHQGAVRRHPGRAAATRHEPAPQVGDTFRPDGGRSARAGGQSRPRHPLDPLSADEIRQAVAILRRDHGVGTRWRFASIELREPAKQAVRGSRRATPVEREARRRVLEPRRRPGLQGAASRSAATACWLGAPARA